MKSSLGITHNVSSRNSLAGSFNYLAIMLMFLAGSGFGCSSGLRLSDNSTKNLRNETTSLSVVPNQIPAPKIFRSILLYANNDPESPPIIKLNSGDKLNLSFDEMTDLVGQFRLSFTHHSKNWEPSNIPQDWYLEGIGEIILGGGKKNTSRGPEYVHYEITISQERIRFTGSGNYLLHISDLESGQELFSLPFFITEDAGDHSSTSQTIYNTGNNYYPEHRLLSQYKYPEFVEYPEFDLTFGFIQNRFWADARFTDSYDFNTPGTAQFDLVQSRAFPANIGYIDLDISAFSQSASNIIEWNPGSTPPAILLKEDVMNFLNIDQNNRFRIYKPMSSSGSGYASVKFRLDGDEYLKPDDELHILGDFNQWTVTDSSKLSLNESSQLWENELLLKQGFYSYQYIKLNGSDIIDLTSLADNSSPKVQEYISMVYFKDPDYKFDRLLSVNIFYAR